MNGLSRTRARGLATTALLTLALAIGCQRSDEDVREWSPADHDHTGGPSAGQVDSRQTAKATTPHGQQGVTDVVLAAWKQNCVQCHGLIGRGDGPQGQALRPPDFTHPTWQKNALDDHMRRTILKGKGSMPAFAHLPETTVDGLIQLIRLLNRERAAGSGAEAPAGNLPPGHP